MQVDEFDFDLPSELIAQHPPPARRDARLLHLHVGADTGSDVASGADIQHRQFPDLLDQLSANDLLVFNDTRVIPARLFGRRPTGGRVEVMIERVVSEFEALVMLRSSKRLHAGDVIVLDGDGGQVSILGRQGEFFRLAFPAPGVALILQSAGDVPLPPYIRRESGADDEDAARYQTIYARKDGAVAAPTAGLHFDDEMMNRMVDAGVATAFLTLHVGAGTFQPVRADDVAQHQMHSERVEVTAEVVRAIADCRARDGRVVAVGTTTVRSLESAVRAGSLQPFAGETDIFIYPGFEFRVVDAMVTNFHLPRSTLMMLVSAFAGRDAVMAAYQSAIKRRYRFFSYGDAMFITRDT